MMLANARTVLAATALTFIAPVAALAQSPAILPGTQIVDTAGNPVGTVFSVKDNTLVVETDKLKVALPASSFTPSNGKLLFALTRDQLNQQTEAAQAEANAKLAAGANVYGQAGTLAGTIETLDADTVTIKLTSGKLVRLQRNAIAAGDKGAVLGVSAAELDRLATTGG